MNDFNNSTDIQLDSNQNPLTDNNVKLWNPNRFILISILFSFLPPAILYSLNYGRLGNAKKRNISLLIFILLFLGSFSLGFFINNPLLNVLYFGLNIGLGIYFQNGQKLLYDKHIQNGGKTASYIVPVILCLLFAALIVLGTIYFIYTGLIGEFDPIRETANGLAWKPTQCKQVKALDFSLCRGCIACNPKPITSLSLFI